MKYLPDGIGLYIHVPFCRQKCLYCDFYSSIISEKVYKDYIGALLRAVKYWGGRIDRPVDTVYFGGGTPSVLGEDIARIMRAIRSEFDVLPDSEITAECNPDSDRPFLRAAKKCGVNRLSIGVQAGDDGRLKTLGRAHTVSDVRETVSAARQAGFDNISCDIMIALPDSDLKTLKEDIEFVCSLLPEHISAYILKIEQNTAFYKLKSSLNLPDDDGAEDQYLFLSSFLENLGYEHYEISSFAKEGKKSRHNLKYWRCSEYLGLGPSAHSFLCGKRFFYPRDLKAFIAGNPPVADGAGGGGVRRGRRADALNERDLEDRQAAGPAVQRRDGRIENHPLQEADDLQQVINFIKNHVETLRQFATDEIDHLAFYRTVAP